MKSSLEAFRILIVQGTNLALLVLELADIVLGHLTPSQTRVRFEGETSSWWWWWCGEVEYVCFMTFKTFCLRFFFYIFAIRLLVKLR